MAFQALWLSGNLNYQNMSWLSFFPLVWAVILTTAKGEQGSPLEGLGFEKQTKLMNEQFVRQPEAFSPCPLLC